jgi:uncharacterized delta-60 repeat protein
LGDLDVANAIAVQPDGKIVLAGFDTGHDPFLNIFEDFAVARYNSDGSPDANFGSSGKLTVNFAQFDQASGVAIRPDGKLIVSGFAFPDLGLAVCSFNPDGTPDSDFGSTGSTTSTLLNGATSLQLRADGKILVGGVAFGPPGAGNDFGVVRLNSNGAVDTAFGSGGLASADFGFDDQIWATMLQPDGKLVAVGRITLNLSAPDLDFALARFNTNGSLYATFGSGGKLSTDFFGGFDWAMAVALQSDGKIVVAGFATTPNSQNSDFGVARYNGGTLFDICLQDDSNGNLLELNSATGDYLFTNCGDFVLGGIGNLTTRGNIITLKHNLADRRVMAQINNGAHKGSATVQFLSPRKLFTITDRNTFNNTCSCGATSGRTSP